MPRYPRIAISLLVMVLGIAASARAQPRFDPQDRWNEDLLHTVNECTDCLAFPVQPDWSALLQQAAPPPQPQHTGFKALVFGTAADFKSFPQRRTTWVILAIGGGMAALVHPLDEELNDRLRSSSTARRIFAPGKYIGSAPVQVGIATGLYLIGRFVLPKTEGEPRTNKLSHLGFDLMRAIIVSETITHTIKIAVRRDRPTGECCSFPSGHSSVSFATASVFERHLGYKAAWPTLLIASYVGASRLYENRHFLSDVVFGAAVGMASGWTVVGRHGRTEYALIPAPIRGGAMVTLVPHFS